MKDFSNLKKNLKKDFSGLKEVKVAVMGDSSTQLYVQALKGYGYDVGLDIDIWEADFNQIESQVVDSNSELYEFDPEFIVIFKSTHMLLNVYNKLQVENQHELAERQLQQWDNLIANLQSRQTGNIIIFNYAEIDDNVFGNYANKVESSFLFQLRKLNYELMAYTAQHHNVHICDLSAVQNTIGRQSIFSPSIYVNTEMVLSIEALPIIAARTISIVQALEGRINKCLILDLDNTVWGGVIGDDGVENIEIGSLGIGKAFTEFQYWAKKLKHRGIILAVCSKNNEEVAKIPFLEHPDMVLSLEDISVFVANWENKVNNIKSIQKQLNIGFDAMVFLDDNPVERDIVRTYLPQVEVPELPEDPAEYLQYLYPLNLFETASYTEEDVKRTALYQSEIQRNELRAKVVNEDEFLNSLSMTSTVQPFNSFNTPRVSQLAQRSNQFNLRTIRYSEEDVQDIAGSDRHITFTFTLDDKFAENGLVCVVVLEKRNQDRLFIESWYMSCRVLKRTMENFVLNEICAKAKNEGFKVLEGEFLPTKKNGLVKEHYKDLGFQEQDGNWMLRLDNFEPRKTYITTKK